MKFHEYIDLSEQERKVVIDALLTEIYDLEKQLAEYKRAEKKELILRETLYQNNNNVGFQRGGKNGKSRRKNSQH